MTKDEFLSAVTNLNLDPDDYIVIGSGGLCVLGIREANDVDLCVSLAVFSDFESRGWTKKTFANDPSYCLVSGIYDVGPDWDSEGSKPNLAELKQDQFMIDGVPFVSLERLRAWKLKKPSAPKHDEDIKLVTEYLAKH